MSEVHRDPAWRRLRDQRLAVAVAQQEPCHVCGGGIDYDTPSRGAGGWTIDHIEEIQHGGELLPGMDGLAPAHRGCNTRRSRLASSRRGAVETRKSGTHMGTTDRERTGREGPFFGRLGGALRPEAAADLDANDRETAGVDLLCEFSPPPRDIWADVEWMRDLVTPPPGSAWPRLMSAPHPDAVGSYGERIERWVREVRGVELRWWQRLAIRRQMEHDDAGQLVWRTVVESTPRRCGKSVRARELLAWRYRVGSTLWEPAQTCMVQGHTLADARAIWDPLCGWIQTVDPEGTHTNRHTTALRVTDRTSGSMLLARSIRGAYGNDIDLGLIDEAWGAPPEPIEQGVRPAMADRLSPQLWLTSTAHDTPTPLMPEALVQAAEEVRHPRSTLLTYWGGDIADGLGTPESWRRWSPHWTQARARQMADAAARLSRQRPTPKMPNPRAAFYTQWLNIWLRPERQAESGGWDAADHVAGSVRVVEHTASPVVAVEVEASGMTYSYAEATTAGVSVRSGMSLEQVGVAWRTSGGYRLVCRSALVPSLPADWMVEGMRSGEEAAALAALSRAAMAGDLRVQANQREWVAQVAAVRVMAGPAGPAISSRLSRGPTQMVWAASAAWWHAERDSATARAEVY